MSEETGLEAPEGQGAESQLGGVTYREYWGRGHAPGPYSDEEREHNRRVFGQTYRELNDTRHKRCIVLCLNPGQRKPIRCPCCYGKIGFRPMDDMPEIEPVPTRGQRFAAWFGGCVSAFLDGLVYPLKRSQEHQVALIRDALQDAMAAGLTAEVVQLCPGCGAAAPLEVAIPRQLEAGE